MSSLGVAEGSGALEPDDPLAKSLRGFGPVGILAILVIVLVGNSPIPPMGGLLVLAWAWRSHTPWRDIGFVQPKSWVATLAAGAVFGIALKLLMKSIVMPLFGADPINHAFHYLAGNQAALPAAIYTMIVGAGFGEETVFRGFLFERLRKLFGSSKWAKTAIVLLTSVVFGLAHYSVQGLTGVEQAVFTGLVFGTIVMATGRLFFVMAAHAAFDLTALAIIYWDVESKVAHFFFK